jgi:hypothetical protein
VHTGWLFGKTHVVPAESVEVSEHGRRIRLPYSEDKVKDAPAYDADAEMTEDKERAAMPLAEEQVKVGKSEVEAGGVRLRKDFGGYQQFRCRSVKDGRQPRQAVRVGDRSKGDHPLLHDADSVHEGRLAMARLCQSVLARVASGLQRTVAFCHNSPVVNSVYPKERKRVRFSRPGGYIQILLLAISALVFWAHSLQGQELDWVRFAGSPGYDEAASICLDQAGDGYVSIMAESPFYGGDLEYTNVNRFAMFITKFRKDGQQLWSAQMEATDFNQKAPLISVATNGTVLVAGAFSGNLTWYHGGGPYSNLTLCTSSSGFDIFLLRMDSAGGLLSGNVYGRMTDQSCTGLACGPDGTVYLAGGHKGWAEFGPIVVNTQSDGVGGGHWIGRFDSNGVPMWVVSLATPNWSLSGPSVTTDPQGNVIVAGPFSQTLKIGTTNLTGPDQEIYVAKFSPQGNPLWIQQGSGQGGTTVSAVTTDPAGNVFVAGSMFMGIWGPNTNTIRFGGSLEITAPAFVVKFDPAGTPVWAQRTIELTSLATGPDASLYGIGLNRISRTNDVFRWDTQGSLSWARCLADSEIGSAGGIAVDGQGAIWVSGASFHSGPSFFQTPVYGATDGAVARFSSHGPTLPRILLQPADQSVTAGGDAVFTVEVEPSPDLVFRWMKGGVELANQGRVTGADSPRLSITGAERADEGVYAIRVQNPGGSVVSATALLHVLASIQFTSIQQFNNDLVRLTFAGNNGFTYRFEGSEDLATWYLITNSGPNSLTLGEIIIVDGPVAERSQRFYRAVLK